MSYSHMGTPTLPSALLHFTSEFGMGSGGSTALLSLDKNFFVNSQRELTNLRNLIYLQFLFTLMYVMICQSYLQSSKPLGCCMVKPHG